MQAENFRGYLKVEEAMYEEPNQPAEHPNVIIIRFHFLLQAERGYNYPEPSSGVEGLAFGC